MKGSSMGTSALNIVALNQTETPPFPLHVAVSVPNSILTVILCAAKPCGFGAAKNPIVPYWESRA